MRTGFILSQTLFSVMVVGMLLIVAEVGLRLGRRSAAVSDVWRNHLNAIQSTVLGLLALLLGFTFSIAFDRYETRRKLVLQEANAVRTTFLRALLLPSEHQAPVQDELRRYVEVRLESIRRASEDRDAIAAGIRESVAIQSELWSHAAAAARQEPGDIVATFIDTLNQTIDAHSERLAAARAEIPIGVWLLLIIVAAWGCLLTGYCAGIDSVRSTFGGILLPLLIAVVLIIIFDLSEPLGGAIKVSQQPLIDLQQSIRR